VALALWLVAGAAERAGGQASGAAAVAARDSLARTTIAMELRAFYRDLEARQWSPLTTHFWPSKVAARWQHPAWPWPGDGAGSSPVAAGASPGTLCAAGARAARRTAALESTIEIDGRWARVDVRRCAGAVPDHFWLLAMNGQWKIVRLTLEHSP
jgi:hypothetical protein